MPRLKPRAYNPWLFDNWYKKSEDGRVAYRTEHNRAVAEQKARLAGKLAVSIEQISKAPITIRVEVKNKSKVPMSFLNDSTPLDPEAFGLGLFQINPHSLPNVNFGNRVLPPRPHYFSYRSLIEISPGMAISDTVTFTAKNSTLKKEWAKMLGVADKVEVRMKGDWKGLWGHGRSEARLSMERQGLYHPTHAAPFESNMIELEF